MFKVKGGKFHTHISPHFGDAGDMTVEEFDKAIPRSVAEGGEVVCLPFVITNDPTGGNMSCMMDHTHYFRKGALDEADHDEEVNGEEMQYEGYFSLASSFFKINNPKGAP